MKLFFQFLFFVLIFNACQSDKETKENVNNDSEQISESNNQVFTPKKPEKAKLIANIDYLRLRAEAGSNGETVAMLKEGDEMFDLGEVSDFSTKVTLRGIKYNEPWIKVETTEGQQGWVFGGGVYFDLDKSSKTTEKLISVRLKSFFGSDLNDKIKEYQTAYQTAASDEKMSEVLIKGKELVAQINDKLEKKLPEPSDASAKKPDLRWLESSFPGYHLGSAAEGTRYYLFRNLKDLAQKTKRTKGSGDNEFVELLLLMYPLDSIEYFFPSYFMQTWDYGGHSLLGEGKHKMVLEKANELMAKHSGKFDTEVEDIKSDLIHDMTASPGGYWYTKSKIIKEFDQIMKAEYGILNEEDLIALKEQRKRFEKPEDNNIKVGLRTGIGQ